LPGLLANDIMPPREIGGPAWRGAVPHASVRRPTGYTEETLVRDNHRDFQARRPRWVKLLLLAPFVAVLWVPFYNSVEPQIAGIPFFYWYQLLWIPLSAILTFFVYLAGE
jgi:hypothetical protein